MPKFAAGREGPIHHKGSRRGVKGQRRTRRRGWRSGGGEGGEEGGMRKRMGKRQEQGRKVSDGLHNIIIL